MDQTVSGRPIARMTIPPMIAKVDPSRKYVTAAPTTPAKPMAVNTFHAGVMDWVKSKCVVCEDGHCVISSFRLSVQHG